MQEEVSSIKSVVTSMFYNYLGVSGTKVLDFCVNLVIGLLILLIGFRLIRLVEKIVKKVFEKAKLDPTLQTFLLSCIRIGLRILIVFWAITRIGVGTSSIIALMGSAGIAVGLSLQGSLSNIAGGVLLLLMKPFEVGHYILEESSSKEGWVQSIGIMYTKLRTLDDKTIMIPNGNLSNSSITNYTVQGRRRVEILIGIHYDENIKKVRKVLSELIEEEASRLEEYPARVFVHEFQDSSICMGMHYWVVPGDYWESRWRMQENIKESFDANGISIPYNYLNVVLEGH